MQDYDGRLGGWWMVTSPPGLEDKSNISIFPSSFPHPGPAEVFGIISFVAFLLFCCGVLAVACGVLTGAADLKAERPLMSESDGSPTARSPG